MLRFLVLLFIMEFGKAANPDLSPDVVSRIRTVASNLVNKDSDPSPKEKNLFDREQRVNGKTLYYQQMKARATSHSHYNNQVENDYPYSSYGNNIVPHFYGPPECASQQICGAVYPRFNNYSVPMCKCPTGLPPCSDSHSRDEYTTELTTTRSGKPLTLVKTCEAMWDIKSCKEPKDWALLALQNIRTGKAHYLMICTCPADGILEGPVQHEQPSYAQVPGIRVYGMLCTEQTKPKRRWRRSLYQASPRPYIKSKEYLPPFPWTRLRNFMAQLHMQSLYT